MRKGICEDGCLMKNTTKFCYNYKNWDIAKVAPKETKELIDTLIHMEFDKLCDEDWPQDGGYGTHIEKFSNGDLIVLLKNLQNALEGNPCHSATDPYMEDMLYSLLCDLSTSVDMYEEGDENDKDDVFSLWVKLCAKANKLSISEATKHLLDDPQSFVDELMFDLDFCYFKPTEEDVRKYIHDMKGNKITGESFYSETEKLSLTNSI